MTPSIGDAAFLGPFVVTITDLREERGGRLEALIRYSHYGPEHNRWAAVSQLTLLPPRRKHHVSKPPPTANATEPGLANAEGRPPPGLGDIVEVFSERVGWRRAVVGQRLAWGTLLRLIGSADRGVDDTDPDHAGDTGAVPAAERVLCQLPLDYTLGDVRWPRPAADSGEDRPGSLEGRRVLVPCRALSEGLEDYLDRCAGVVKQASSGDVRGVLVSFPRDGSTGRFSAARVREWLIEPGDARAAAEWEESAGPAPLPPGWPDDVLFCSFPLQRGIEQSLVKSYCTGSERMRGVEIREVTSTHPCGGRKNGHFNRGLFATTAFKPGDVLGTYAGSIQSAGGDGGSRGQRGQYAITLDTSRGFGRPVALELDARDVGNESRFINDYRGTSADPAPNVRFTTSCVAGRGVWVQISVVAPIQADDEVLVDYGEDFWKFRSGPDPLPPPAAVPHTRQQQEEDEDEEEDGQEEEVEVPWASGSPSATASSPPKSPAAAQRPCMGPPPPIEKEMFVECYLEKGCWKTFQVTRVNRRNDEMVSFSITGGQCPIKPETYGVSWRLVNSPPRAFESEACAESTAQQTRSARDTALLHAGPPSKRTRGAQGSARSH
jgi:hypothetical protein